VIATTLDPRSWAVKPRSRREFLRSLEQRLLSYPVPKGGLLRRGFTL
jgi:hypothetical protein